MTRTRFKLDDEAEKEVTGGLYGLADLPDPTEFVRTGCTLLDEMLGGGWALGRISNVYGESATGKSLLGVEACANFAHQFPNGKIFYRERESAFDEDYAENIGMRIDEVDIKRGSEVRSVEDLFDDLNETLKGLEKSKQPGLYCIDSLDGYPAEAELDKKDIRDDAKIAAKAARLSEIFRLVVQRVDKCRLHLMFISQVRTRIGVTHGRKTEMSGGKAIRFYASQRVFLRQTETIKHTVKGLDRPVGIYVNAKCEKSRHSSPFRDVDFPILFAWGIDDFTANLEFLVKTNEQRRLDIPREKGAVDKYIAETWKLDRDEYQARLSAARRAVRDVWQEIEEEVRRRYYPPHAKYR